MKQKTLRFVLFVLVSMITQTVISQGLKTISGIVTDSITGAPLTGASILIEGTRKGVSADAKGYFEIQANTNDILVFSDIGYNTRKLTIGNRTTINVQLSESGARSLNEVVVTALGIKREARSLGYSNQTVTGADVTKADPPTIAQGLIGKAAGLNISVPNGVEGNSSRIVIRGNNSLLGNNQPLIVVDGVMIDNEPILPQGQNLTTQNLLGQNTDVSQNQSTDYGSFLNTCQF